MNSHDCPRVFYLEGIVPLLLLFKLLQLGHLVRVVRQLYKAFVFPHTLGLKTFSTVMPVSISMTSGTVNIVGSGSVSSDFFSSTSSVNFFRD